VKPLNAVDKALIAAIHDENVYFNMAEFCRFNEASPATCETASCMAGHIEALYPEVTAEIIRRRGYMPDHAFLAEDVYKEVTGEKCRLDFFGYFHPGDELSPISRDAAILHIAGISEDWPLRT